MRARWLMGAGLVAALVAEAMPNAMASGNGTTPTVGPAMASSAELAVTQRW